MQNIIVNTTKQNSTTDTRTHNEQYAEIYNGNIRKYGMPLTFRKKNNKTSNFSGTTNINMKCFFLQIKWNFEIKNATLSNSTFIYMINRKKKNNGFFPQLGKDKFFMLKNNIKKL